MKQLLLLILLASSYAWADGPYTGIQPFMAEDQVKALFNDPKYIIEESFLYGDKGIGIRCKYFGFDTLGEIDGYSIERIEVKFDEGRTVSRLTLLHYIDTGFNHPLTSQQRNRVKSFINAVLRIDSLGSLDRYMATAKMVKDETKRYGNLKKEDEFTFYIPGPKYAYLCAPKIVYTPAKQEIAGTYHYWSAVTVVYR